MSSAPEPRSSMLFNHKEYKCTLGELLQAIVFMCENCFDMDHVTKCKYYNNAKEEICLRCTLFRPYIHAWNNTKHKTPDENNDYKLDPDVFEDWYNAVVNDSTYKDKFQWIDHYFALYKSLLENKMFGDKTRFSENVSQKVITFVKNWVFQSFPHNFRYD